jgi:hypothetical protein
LLFDANLLRIVRRVTPSENDYGFVEFGAEGKKLTTKNAPTETDATKTKSLHFPALPRA